jgi:hypothetical protein
MLKTSISSVLSIGLFAQKVNFEAHGLEVQEWDKMPIDLITIRNGPASSPVGEGVGVRKEASR